MKMFKNHNIVCCAVSLIYLEQKEFY